MSNLKLFLLGLLLASVTSTLTMTYASSNPYCAAPGELTLGIADQTALSFAVDFDFISTYYNSDFQSVPLMVIKGDPLATPTAKDFTFYSYTNDLADVVGKVCTGTSGYTFIDIIGSYLFLVDNSTSPADYYVCSYLHTLPSITPQKLTTSGLVTGTIALFDPYLNDGNYLFVLMGNGVGSQVVKFNAADGTSTAIGNPTTKPLLTAHGNSVFLYDEASKKFLEYSSNAWSTVTTGLPDVASKTVKITGLRQQNLIVNIITSALSSNIFSIAGSVATQQVVSSTSSFPVKDFTDGVNDYVHITSTELSWLTLPNSANAVIYKSTIPSSLNSQFINIINVGLSGNKAVILYNNNKLQYLKHRGTDSIVVLFSKVYNTGEVGVVSDGKQYKLSITCMCAGVDRMACFSATLNCVIIRKAGIKCNEGTDTNSKTW